MKGQSVYHQKSCILALLTVMFLILAGLAFPEPGIADAGPFPTKTPTRTLVPIILPTVAIPTPLVLTIVPSLSPQQQLLFTATQPGAQVEGVQAELEQTEEAAAPSLALACWPIAIILVLAIILGASYVLSRGKGD